ncbi:MAG TPA: hypothetical protein VK498_14050 [Ferruginibacter sp.]|nr:hypothetical protein [Ferruginibacter sp.]
MKIFFSVMIGLVVFSGCNTPGSTGDPKLVLSQFMDALMKKDIATARKFSTEDSKSMFDLIEMGMKNEKGGFEKYDKSKLTFADAIITGDKAIVPVTEKTSGETVNFTLKKEKGQWKVAFDMASLMTMGMEKMSEKGISQDSLHMGMEQMKNMNMDSLRKGMEEGMKTFDSINNELKKIKDTN